MTKSAQPAKPRPPKKNDQVDAVADAISLNEDATTANLAASLLSNDRDPDRSDVIRITSVTQGAKGSVVFNDGGTPSNSADDTLTYRADGAVLDALAAGESTTDTFSYTVSDGHGSTDTASVTVTINGVSDQVDAVADAISVNQDATTANLATSLLLNDRDPDTSDVIRITGVTQGAKGSVVFNDGGTPTNRADDTLTYTADDAVLDALAAGESTTDTFSYTVSDGHGSTDTASVTVTINGVSDQVDAVADAISVNQDATTANLATSLLLNDRDPDTSDVIRITGVTQGAKGSVVFNDGGTPTNRADDTLTYTADDAVLDALAAGESTTDTFSYTVSDGHGSTDTASVTVTINGVNDQVGPPMVSIAATDGSGTEAAEGSPDFTFTFTRTGDTTQALSVNYSVFSPHPNGAFTGSDIDTSSSGIVTFAAGSATATLTFDAINDLQAENTESFTVWISGDSNYTNPSYTVGAQALATGTVIDNDGGALPVVSIADAAAVEGGVLSFTLTRTGDTSGPLTVFLTGGFSGSYDYTAMPTSVTFAVGSATATVNVQTLDDTQDEADETVTLSIGPSMGYVASGQTQATGTLLDNDAPFTGTPATITVVATDGSGTEAADGSPDFTFTFTRTGDTTQALSVNYSVFSPHPNGAFTGSDIDTSSSGIVTFAAGSATATLTFDAINDLQAENTESFTVWISGDSNYTNPSYTVGAQALATGTVIDNDGGDTFEFSSAAFAGFVPDNISTDFSNKGEIRHDMSSEQNVVPIDLERDAIAYMEIEPINHTGMLSNADFLLF